MRTRSKSSHTAREICFQKADKKLNAQNITIRAELKTHSSFCCCRAVVLMVGCQGSTFTCPFKGLGGSKNMIPEIALLLRLGGYVCTYQPLVQGPGVPWGGGQGASKREKSGHFLNNIKFLVFLCLVSAMNSYLCYLCWLH